MTSPTIREALSRALKRYPLAGATAIDILGAARRNDNFLVEDSGGRRYVLRRYRRNPKLERVQFQLRFQQELRSRGFPTSDVIMASAGESFVQDDGGVWALFSYVDGEEYDFGRIEQAVEAGRQLAELHLKTDSIDLAEVSFEHSPDVRRWWTRAGEEITALAEFFDGRGVETELEFLRDWHSNLAIDWPFERLETLPAGWIHGDYHGANLVFSGATLRGLIDFDVVCRGFRVEDIGLALFMFAREFRGSTRIRLDVAERFLEAYEDRRPLTDSEHEALPLMAVLAWAPSAPYHAMLARDGEDSLTYFRRFVLLMRDIEGEMDGLALRLAGLTLDAADGGESPSGESGT